MDSNNNNADSPDREMIKGNWKCADCGTEITELPFKPAADRPIYCRDCWSKKRDEGRRGFSPRETVKGNWKCADCGTKITELPFKPSGDTPIYCKECWLKRRT